VQKLETIRNRSTTKKDNAKGPHYQTIEQQFISLLSPEHHSMKFHKCQNKHPNPPTLAEGLYNSICRVTKKNNPKVTCGDVLTRHILLKYMEYLKFNFQKDYAHFVSTFLNHIDILEKADYLEMSQIDRYVIRTIKQQKEAASCK
jgi:hypothetical protein